MSVSSVLLQNFILKKKIESSLQAGMSKIVILQQNCIY